MGYFGDDEEILKQKKSREEKIARFLSKAIPKAIAILKEFSKKTPSLVTERFSPIKMILVLERDYFGRPKVNWRPPMPNEVPPVDVMQLDFRCWSKSKNNCDDINRLLDVDVDWFEKNRYRFAKPREAYLISNGGVKIYLGTDGKYYFFHMIDIEYSMSERESCYVYRGEIEVLAIATAIARDYANALVGSKALRVDAFEKELVEMLKPYLVKAA